MHTRPGARSHDLSSISAPFAPSGREDSREEGMLWLIYFLKLRGCSLLITPNQDSVLVAIYNNRAGAQGLNKALKIQANAESQSTNLAQDRHR